MSAHQRAGLIRRLRHTVPMVAGLVCLAAGGPAVLTGCAAPQKLMQTLDQQHATISQRLTNVIDRADKVFGEARVEDKLRLVQAKLGPSIEWRQNHGTSFSFPVTLRAPFPALERWANIFFQIDTISDTYSTFSDVGSAIDKNKAFTLSWLSTINDIFDSGVRLNAYWHSGPQAAIKPFVRWEKITEPFHFLAEQQVYYKTDDGIGGITAFLIDRKLSEESFLRFATSAEYYQQLNGMDLSGALIYRRPFFFDSFLSCELGLNYNPNHPSPPKTDDDKAYAYLRMVGTVWRTWMEYELRPEIFSPLYGPDRLEFGFKFIFRFVYEDFLSGT